MHLIDQVKNILIEYEGARNSDITLTILLWQKFYGVEDSLNVNKLYDLPTQDAIKRYRAEIQNEKGLYLPTDPEILKQRKINEQLWKQELDYQIHLTDEKIINHTQDLWTKNS